MRPGYPTTPAPTDGQVVLRKTKEGPCPHRVSRVVGVRTGILTQDGLGNTHFQCLKCGYGPDTFGGSVLGCGKGRNLWYLQHTTFNTPVSYLSRVKRLSR